MGMGDSGWYVRLMTMLNKDKTEYHQFGRELVQHKNYHPPPKKNSDTHILSEHIIKHGSIFLFGPPPNIISVRREGR